MINSQYVPIFFLDDTAQLLYQSEAQALYALLVEFITQPEEMPFATNRGVDWTTENQIQKPPVVEIAQLVSNYSEHFQSLTIQLDSTKTNINSSSFTFSIGLSSYISENS